MNIIIDIHSFLCSLNDSLTTVKNTTASTALSNLSDGIYAISVNAGTVITGVTIANNVRGIAVKQGNVTIGFVSDYNSTNVYVLSSSNGTGWEVAKKITTA